MRRNITSKSIAFSVRFALASAARRRTSSLERTRPLRFGFNFGVFMGRVAYADVMPLALPIVSSPFR